MPLCVEYENYTLNQETLESIQLLRPAWVSEGQPCHAYQLLTSAEYEQLSQQGAGSPWPLSLTYEQGASVAGAVASVWIAAWAFKAIYRLFDGSGSED